MDLIKAICEAASDKKARRITVTDISKMTVITDNFIICSGDTKNQVKAICDNIEEKLARDGEKPIRIDGYNEARWIVMDYGSVFVHIFTEDDREFYNLERLWNNGNNSFVFSD